MTILSRQAQEKIGNIVRPVSFVLHRWVVGQGPGHSSDKLFVDFDRGGKRWHIAVETIMRELVRLLSIQSIVHAFV